MKRTAWIVFEKGNPKDMAFLAFPTKKMAKEFLKAACEGSPRVVKFVEAGHELSSKM